MSGIGRRGPRTDGPALIAAVHGTSDPAGAQAVRLLIEHARILRPGLAITAAFLSDGNPALADALAAAAARGHRPVVVPMLLGSGYHVRHDIPRASTAVDALVAAHFGPDPLVVEVLAERVLPLLRARPGADVVLVSAGSRDPRAAREAGRAAELLAARIGTAVGCAFLTSTSTATSPEALLARRCEERPVVVATYLLAPGRFSRRVRQAASGAASSPLAPHPLLARLLLDRYDAVLAAHSVDSVHSAGTAPTAAA